MQYPYQTDCVWLVSSCGGDVAALITAGEGPIPSDVLTGSDIGAMERTILDCLPRSSSATILANVSKPDSYRALAERGLFVYDWTDVHSSKLEKTGAYELVAAPDRPLNISSMPDNLRDLLAATQVESFERLIEIDGVMPDVDWKG